MTGAILAGFAAGVLTGAGIGGGTLLLVYLTNFGGMEQRQAQGINLLYFLLTAPPALYGHLKNGLVDKPLALRAGAAGVATAALTAWLTAGLDTDLLRRAFGVFTVLVGLREVFCKKEG
ncbi:MAG: sulfite exporter TauE/SafE family protein [Clostridia bacterium]|nr:sulfite exporter TauE/SafE family protein [Clostridia bacterium]